MISEKCEFCSRVLKSIQEIEDHSRDVHSTTVENNPVFKNYFNVVNSDPHEFIMEGCDYCKKLFFESGKKARHYLSKHLRPIANPNSSLIIRKIGSKYLEFSINYDKHKNFYDFYTPEKVIRQFIEDVFLKIPNEEGEFKLVSNLMNQSMVDIEGRKIYSNKLWTTGAIQRKMDDRVNEFLYVNTKIRVLVNGESGSSIYFHRFIFLKLIFDESDVAK